MMELAAPEACERREFEAREPALGLSMAQVDELEAHSRHPDLLPVQQRMLFSSIEGCCRRQLISTDGMSTVSDICALLRAEIEAARAIKYSSVSTS